MKQRIVAGLLHLSDSQNYSDTTTIRVMLPELCKKTGFSRDEIGQKAKEVLFTVLHNYDDFAIRTIDSFVSRIIRTFAHDLHLPLDFEIEMDQDMLLDEAVDNLISRAGIDKEITPVLVDFTESKAEEERSWHIERDLKEVGSVLFSEEGYKFKDKLAQISPSGVLTTMKEISRYRQMVKELLIKPATEAIELIRRNQIDHESFFYGKQGIGSFFQNLSDGSVIRANTRVTATIEKNSWTSSKADARQQAAIRSISGELDALYRQCEAVLDKHYQDYQMLGAFSESIYQLGVISGIEQELSAVKAERKVLPISEFNKRITEIILKEPVPFIYERTGERYRNFLIDEFQDTSELQWKNLLPLITDSLSSGHFNLIVGDGKQAIYRFRSGKVEQFMLLPALPAGYEKEVFGEGERIMDRNFHEEPLSNNFRSLPVVVQFNNEFFGFISGKLDESLKSIYKKHEQTPPEGKSGGYVSVDFLDSGSQEEFRDATLNRILEITLKLMDEGRKLSDIVILTRSNLQGSTIAKFLLNNGINVVSAEALLLATSRNVNFIVSVLKMLNDPQDAIASASVLIGLSIRDKLKAPAGDIGTIVQNGTVLEQIRMAGYDLRPARLHQLPLYDLCEEVIRLFGLTDDGYDPYIQFFLEFVAANVSREPDRLSDLLEKWEEKKEKLSVILPEGLDAVRIMTIHKAKGLEFPVVIWPFATDALKSTRQELWVEPTHPVLSRLPVALLRISKQLTDIGYGDEYTEERNKSLLDMINLIYVAFTRPIEQLYVVSREVGGKSSEAITLPAFLAEYVGTSLLPWKKEGTAYRLGEPVSATARQEKQDHPHPERTMVTAPWHDRIRISRRAPHSWSVGQVTDHQTWGNLVHAALSKVTDMSSVDDVCRLIAANSGLDEPTALKLETRVHAVISHPQLKPFFDGTGNVRPESEILLPDGNLLRPDRVVIRDNEVTILEFKTGQPLEEHRQQVTTYAGALYEMGYRPIRKFLIYIDDQVEVQEVC